MKKIKIFCLLHLFLLGFAQNRLNDPSIVAQHKRMVFESWGDWRPYPKYNFIGIQTNLAYGTIWGSGNFIAPSRNVRYRKGADIRPLRVGGKEMLRQGEVQLQQKQAEKLAKSVDSIYSRNVADFAHWTHLTTDADPLWLLYYKRMLRPLIEYPNTIWEDGKVVQWALNNPVRAILWQGNNWDKRMDKKLEIMKSDLDLARKTNMPRGKRMLLYHRVLKKWRSWKIDYNEELSPVNGLTKFIKMEQDIARAIARKKSGDNDGWEFGSKDFYEIDKEIYESRIRTIQYKMDSIERENEKYKFKKDIEKDRKTIIE